MPRHIFDLFTRTITDLPIKAVIKALDLECKMLEEDFAHNRLAMPKDALSILCFWQFVRTVKSGETMRCVKPLPAVHIEFYKTTIVRLVQANELPPSAMEQFDCTFAWWL